MIPTVAHHPLHELKLSDEKYGRAKVLVVPFAATLPEYVRALKGQTYDNLILVSAETLRLREAGRIDELTAQVMKFGSEVRREVRIELCTNKDTGFPQEGIWVGGLGNGFFYPALVRSNPVHEKSGAEIEYIPGWSASPTSIPTVKTSWAAKLGMAKNIAVGWTSDKARKTRDLTKRAVSHIPLPRRTNKATTHVTVI